MKIQLAAASLLVLSGVAPHGAPAHAAGAIQTGNCPNGLCAQFNNTATIPVIKAFTFTNPVGAAAVTFTASMFCAAQGAPIQDKVIDLNSAITETTTEAIASTTPSYMRHAHVLKDESDHQFDSSTSFNLQTTRVINYSTAGRATVYFRIARARQDAGVTCYVYGGSFSIIRTP